MNQLMGFWFSNKANDVTKEINDVPKNIKGGAKKMVSSVTEKKKKPLGDVLQEFELPAGIFPREATKYKLDKETRKLIVTLPNICEVSYRDGSVLRFSNSVTCHIEKGKLTEIEGLKTKVVIWMRVTSIVSEETKLHFSASRLNKTRERKAYQAVRDGVPVDNF